MDLRLKTGQFRPAGELLARIAVKRLSCFACGSYMIELTPDTKKYFRTLLILGRISNLPTVWSNCVAGWLLGGGGDLRRLGWLCAGASLLYMGGMYLNDACDSHFDALHRAERPIPSRA